MFKLADQIRPPLSLRSKLDQEPASRPAMRLSLEERETLLSSAGADTLFDSLLPARYRCVSELHWTPATVVAEVEKYLQDSPPNLRLIDIGSGVGKFCLLLALSTKLPANFQITGVEKRRSLIKIAQQIQKANDLENVAFIKSDMCDLDWNLYDIFYFYNPFQEHLLTVEEEKIDRTFNFSRSSYANSVSEVFRQLCLAEEGKQLISYHGYGGEMPSGWNLEYEVEIGTGKLCFWRKIK